MRISDWSSDVCSSDLALIARSGCRVTGVDVSHKVVDTINSGKVHIEEVDLDGLVQGVVARGALTASTEVAPADTFVIAVPTPHDEAHRPDVSHVLSAARAIAPEIGRASGRERVCQYV